MTTEKPQIVVIKDAHSIEYLKKIKGNKNVVFYFDGKEIKLDE